MNSERLIAERMTTAIQRLGNTGDSMVVNVGDVFWQAASFPDEGILVEVAGNGVLPEQHRLDEAASARMEALGFNKPDTDMPNWWFAIESGPSTPTIPSVRPAAQAVTAALLHLFGIPVLTLARKTGLSVLPFPPAHQRYPDRRPPEDPIKTLEVESMRGPVVFSSDGTATLAGRPWVGDPVTRWAVNPDGRIVVYFRKIEGDEDWFPWVAFTANTDETRRLLSAFVPSDPQVVRLGLRLAVLEHHWLECLRTDTVPDLAVWRQHHELLRLLRLDAPDDPLLATHLSPSQLAGWPRGERLLASLRVLDAVEMSGSADTQRELARDTQDILRALQAWVAVSPWRDAHPFAIPIDNDFDSGDSAMAPVQAPY